MARIFCVFFSKEATLSVEMTAKEELRLALEKLKKESQKECDVLAMEVKLDVTLFILDSLIGSELIFIGNEANFYCISKCLDMHLHPYFLFSF